MNEFSMMQRCHEVEVGDIHCHEVHTLCGDHTVEKYFGYQHFCGLGGYLARVVDSVSYYHELYLAEFSLFWSDQANKLPVGDIFHAFCQYLMLEDKLNSDGRVLYATFDAVCPLPIF
jgi:hypothetical protein